MGVISLGVEKDVSRSSQPRATTIKAIVALEAEVGGLHHVGNTNMWEDGVKGLLNLCCSGDEWGVTEHIQVYMHSFLTMEHLDLRLDDVDGNVVCDVGDEARE